jgi:hypothetical protein
MILILLISEFLSITTSYGTVDGLRFDLPTPSIADYGGLSSYAIDGCSMMDDVHLPVRYVRLPIEPGTTPQVRVEVTGTRIIGPSAGVASSFFTEDGTESFREASSSLLPDQWSRVVQYGTWRRAGFVEVALYPVTARGGELHCASGMRVVVEGQDGSSTRRVLGHQGLLYDLFFSTGNGYTLEPRSRSGSSPFWGRPWARVQVDTAGVFQVTGALLPQAVGMPSSTFSMYRGRGRGMSEDAPWGHSFEPIPVPVLVEDGGDGVFDGTDRVLFYGRGLSWWDDRIGFDGLHYNGQYDSLNTYWLTWGDAGGPFMEVRDCSITGAPSATDHYLGRHHFEKNYIREVSVWDYWSWSRLSGSHTQTATISFDTQGATGPGLVRVGLVLSKRQVRVTAILNGVTQGDTILAATGRHILTFDVSGFKNAGNILGVRFSQVSGLYELDFDWVSVFPEKGFSSSSTAMEVPLVYSIPIGERRRVDWAQNLDQARAFLVNGDELVHALDLPGGNAFEIEVPYGWRMPVMFMYPTGSLPEPYSVTSASPGRIRGTLAGGDIIVVYPDEFGADMPLLDRPDGRSRVFVSLTEVWDEFNGGVRDPQAVRAMLDWVLHTWDPLPTEVVLVGVGHFDPRHFLYSQPCPMDVLVIRLSDEGVSDDRYGLVSGSANPQFGVSRLLASNRSELQVLAQRAWDYFTLSASGEWQSEIIAAADDERLVINGVSYYTDTYHTNQTEAILESFPGRFFVDRQYGIFHTWNDAGKKPEWRQSFIDAWSRGALVLFFMGHGSFDQIADEGLFYLEDWAQLGNGARLPYALFGSCDVGMFQYPGRKCISGEVTLPPSGGAITSLGATLKTQGSSNQGMLSSIFTVLMTGFDLSMSEATFLGKINHGGNWNKYYTLFGDGSLGLALPDSGITHSFPVLRTGEMTTIEGALTGREGQVMVSAWESMQPDTYYTYQTNLPIRHFSVPGLFHRGFAQAVPGFTQDIFVPLVATTGNLARVRFFSPGAGGGSLSCVFPGVIEPGNPSGDSDGPVIESWIQGYRGTPVPRVSGEVWFCAELSDPSGINLLPYPGAQLALYVDDVPSDVSSYFTFDQGSAESGRLLVPLQSLPPGMHQLRLRATDCLLNISWSEMEFEVVSNAGPVLEQVWVYPNPSSDMAGFHWLQSGSGPVDIRVYTVAGRSVIAFRNLQGEAGYNQSLWDLRDADGDPVASGAYVYTVTAGESSVTGVMAVVAD